MLSHFLPPHSLQQTNGELLIDRVVSASRILNEFSYDAKHPRLLSATKPDGLVQPKGDQECKRKAPCEHGPGRLDLLQVANSPPESF
jgi:hypothetical protein